MHVFNIFFIFFSANYFFFLLAVCINSCHKTKLIELKAWMESYQLASVSVSCLFFFLVKFISPTFFFLSPFVPFTLSQQMTLLSMKTMKGITDIASTLPFKCFLSPLSSFVEHSLTLNQIYIYLINLPLVFVTISNIWFFISCLNAYLILCFN